MSTETSKQPRRHYDACDIEVGAFGDFERFECDDGEVWIDGDVLLISYFDEAGIVVLEGWPDKEEAGTWRLSARSRPRRAFLRPMAEASDILVGEIDEQGDVAPWRLRLGGLVND